MRSVGGYGGLDLTQDLRPPKTLYIEVSNANGRYQPYVRVITVLYILFS